MTSTETEYTEDHETAQMVTVIEAESRWIRPRVEAQGSVIPAREVTVEPQVSGRVSQRHPGFVTGGVVREDEPLFEVEPRDYRLAVEQARTEVELARADLEKEKGRRVVAEQEWERFGEPDEEPPPLALREPQQKQAELQIQRAEQELRQAQLDLERTRPRAPFTALVREANIEPGDVVSPQSSTATLVGLDEFWVQVSVPVDVLGRVAIPGRDGDIGSPALIRHDSGAHSIEHRGEVIRLLGDLDPTGRTARLLVSVEDPFSMSGRELDDPDPGTPVLREAPLLLDSFVSVELLGIDASWAIQLPRRAVRNGDQAYVVTDGGLEIRDIDIAWRNSDTVTVTGGIDDGDLVIVSNLPAPVAGMPLRAEITDPPDWLYRDELKNTVDFDTITRIVEAYEPRPHREQDQQPSTDELATYDTATEESDAEESSVDESDDESNRDEDAPEPTGEDVESKPAPEQDVESRDEATEQDDSTDDADDGNDEPSDDEAPS